MNTKYSLFVVGMMVSLPLMSQETYINADIVTEDLNGTARYVGMGGAMEALGADISTIGTNPAGIGLFRHSMINTSFGFVSQQDAADFANGNKTNMSFDQIGFVYSTRMGQQSFINFAFNYHKSRNFNYILNATGGLAENSSQNRATYNKAYTAASNGWDIALPNSQGVMTANDDACSQLDQLYFNSVSWNPLISDDFYGRFCYYASDLYRMNRATTGYIGEYDFNISGNINDRVYLGLTIGIHDVHYSDYSEYYERFVSNQEALGGVSIEDSREITGTGYDLKLGAIFRPIEESPFRIGLSIATPTFYDLKTSNYTKMIVDDRNANSETYSSVGMLDIANTYDYQLYTPWRFGLSLGHTIGNYLALGASYEYADYGSTDSRINDGYDWDGYYTSDSDLGMNKHTKAVLKGVSTLKVGAEFKPDDDISVRLGFNYLSPMYNKGAMKDGFINSPGNSYQSATDYTNWNETYRITTGLGYRLDNFVIDLAYQYTQTDGTFHPFGDVLDASNVADAVKVNDKRHQLLMTLGYVF